MDYFNLLLGILIVIATILYLRYELNEFKKTKKFYIKIFAGIIAGVLLGALKVYRELKY